MNLRPVNAMLGASLATFLAYSLVACPPPIPKPPPIDAADASESVDAGESESNVDASRFPSCVSACAKMKSLGCPEAETPDGGKTCYRLCADAEASKKFNLKPACIAGCGDIACVRGCGSVRCLK